MLRIARSTARPALALWLAACAADAGQQDRRPLPEDFDDAPVLSNDSVRRGAPSNDTLPEEGKADAVYPERFDLLALQSPVRNQARRGVCSIFATVGLMESLYIAEGTIANPDFSEQFLQWSAKVEAGGFREDEGSNASVNLDAIARFGIPEEAAWPYEPEPWTTANDPACTGERRPTRCWTNGDPPPSALEAMRWRLPRGRWISSRTRSIKAHMVETNTPVVVGLDFFYQAWNHRGSKLVTSRERFARGWVTYPNDADIADSEMRPAGHAILLVGWDDTLEVPLVDGQGQPLLDERGEPRVERGFFLFKNSWGTGSFGIDNPAGPGYGWISYRYVERYGSAYVSGLPRVEPPREQCANDRDDDRDGAADCADADCAMHASCGGPPSETIVGESRRAMPIPDDDPTGISSEIKITDAGRVRRVEVDVDIAHPYRGDLVVALRRDDVRVVLFDRDGGSADDLVQTFEARGFEGVEAAGRWYLEVRDTAAADLGTLRGWRLRLFR
ncbi:MAG: proprotein convertase P-domain-containing protein [Myxococcota bacterium]|nr:proprotein convertase P-domain-containing protein [Myxococcota bacterium]MDW8361733.1 proprotein convertase P-domain-containing protein [Myxococcales bacterium]